MNTFSLKSIPQSHLIKCATQGRNFAELKQGTAEFNKTLYSGRNHHADEKHDNDNIHFRSVLA